MLKNKYPVLFILFILLLILLIFSRTTLKQVSKSGNSKPATKIKTSVKPEQTVINFYGTYLTYKGNLLSKEAFENSNYLTDDFKDKLISELSKNPTVNPIICLKQKPEEISVHTATISSGLAQVLVTQTLEENTYAHLLKLKLVGNEYKIYDIICN